MVDNNAIIEGAVKFRDGKKWKTRWCVMTKISPVADCLHLQLYRDCKDRYKQGQTKASLSLQHFLGLESGFTLDKESNTVAIICQDLTVVLAFDTRERLIQWQVKIGTHLGEDQQFLIQISTAPAKSKVATGPARLHIQDHKFCLTTGVPPRLLGVWEIGHLRRYGVVDGKFCFEGGSRCSPRGEGLYVLGCGQASEVHQAMQLAAQGRLATRRRPISRKMSAMDSPRKGMHSRAETRASDLSCADSLLSGELLSRSLCDAAHGGSATMEDLSGRRSPWGSAESAHTDLMDSCSDATSVVAADLEMERRGAMERCASCISKLGAISNKGTTFSPAWTMEQHSQSACLNSTHPADRTSLSSGSSGGSSATDWYDRPRAVQPPPSVPPKSPKHAPTVAPAPRCQCCPPERPPKPPSPKKAAPAPYHRPLPGHAQAMPQAEEHNYDVPRSFLHARMPLQERHSSLDYYDTPKKIREAITTAPEYSNYDTPPIAKSIRQPCGCVHTLTRRPIEDSTRKEHPYFTQHNVPNNSCSPQPSKPEEFTSVHAPKRPMMPSNCGHTHGNEGVTNTQYTRVELDDGRQYFRKEAIVTHCVKPEDQNQPNQQCASNKSQFARKDGNECSGLQYVWNDAHNKQQQQHKKNIAVGCGIQMARMATEGAGCPCQRVMCWSELLPCRRGSGAEDTGVPIHKVRLNGEGRMPVRDPSGQLSVLYATVDKSKKKPKALPSPNYVNIGEPQQANYANMEFAHSLENYENAKDILQRAGITKEDIEHHEDHDHLCQKCGHAPEQYLVMEPKKKPFPGYLAMGPANLGRASSIPALTSRNQQLSDTLSSTSSLHHSPGMSDLRTHALQRKRSSSADASRFLSDDEEIHTEEVVTSQEIENSQERLSITQEEVKSETTDSTISDYTQINPSNNTDSDISIKDISAETDSIEMKERLMTLPRSNIEDLKEKPVAVHIRRSSSVPCKTGHNRDSSSSNDSGVSAGSPHFPDLDPRPVCLHSSLPRRCKSSDPLKDMKTGPRLNGGPAKSSSAEAEVPINVQPSKAGNSRTSMSHPGGYTGTNGEGAPPAPYPDSHSTSSGTSDMSDYIETLSLSSHSSSDIPDSLRLIGRPATTTLRPRSGREYQKIDRAFIETDLKGAVAEKATAASLRSLAQYPGIDKCESPSPGYMSGSSGQEREMQDGQQR